MSPCDELLPLMWQSETLGKPQSFGTVHSKQYKRKKQPLADLMTYWLKAMSTPRNEQCSQDMLLSMLIQESRRDTNMERWRAGNYAQRRLSCIITTFLQPGATSDHPLLLICIPLAWLCKCFFAGFVSCRFLWHTVSARQWKHGSRRVVAITMSKAALSHNLILNDLSSKFNES